MQESHPTDPPPPSYPWAAYLLECGREEEACDVYRALLEIQVRQGQPEQVSTCEMLADLLGQRDLLDEALELYQRSLEFQIEQLGPAHPELANTHRDRARLLRRHGRDDEAEQAYRQMLAMRVLCHGPSHPALIPGLIEMADFLSSAKAEGEALAVKARALIEEFELESGPLHQLLEFLPD